MTHLTLAERLGTVPGHVTVVVRAQCKLVKGTQTVCFEPGVRGMTESGLLIEDSLLEPDKDGW